MKPPIKIITLILFSALALNLNSCSEETTLESDPFVVAFETLSKNLAEMHAKNDTSIPLVYSEMAIENGSVNIKINAKNAIYGQDFITIPEAINQIISLPISNGETQSAIQFQKLTTTLDETTEIEFLIASIDYQHANVQGNSIFTINSSAAQGGSMLPEIGGPNQDNQVYIDLSTQSATSVKRDAWDLGFYNGANFRVAINGSVYMAAKALTETDIDAVTEDDVRSLKSQVAVGTFNAENAAYIDAPNGNIHETAIAEISENNDENPVYLVNLGYEIGTSTPTVGSTAVAGNTRGWKKIRILRAGDDYMLQYADLDENTHQEITISKHPDYNFNHFSFNSNALVSVEPESEKWDINFTVFTNLQDGAGSYGFSDFVLHNRKAGVTAYQVETSDYNYDDFSISDVNTSLFSEDQTTIGSNWRDVFERTVFSDKFYIIKDPNGNLYKLKFLAMTNSNGERGYPEFEFKLLQ
ncbi:HmuY family protein [Tamlana sp. 2_MG-2023]|uniref:HmuY family protein n=1 Tax=unclassified Tamlana TaxID=2614803 RepID=UPI0026E3B4F5|nr:MULTISPECIES: HmuY family protein [unclassified Tamlana]MDO6760467.1 HmuY family protein [Tamlana sp. 2_MG-2023]MDO6790723.1 HmuY family protein [Tamlana sp. 1_MG-2023]